jgi:hypothetical protein
LRGESWQAYHRQINSALWPKNIRKGKSKMNLKHIIIYAVFIIGCSPNLIKVEDNLIGNWNNSIAINATLIDRTDLSNLLYWDSVFYTKQIQINSNEIKLIYIIRYKIHDSLSTECKDTVNYIKSNDTLNITLNNNKSYYKYNIRNDSLIISYLYGDTVKYDSLTPLLFDKFKKE